MFGFWDQVALWFGAASLPAAWYYGALMAGWAGLPGALLFIVLVSALTLVPWAFLGHIAADTGGASIAIVRPAFGLRGSLVPSLFYLVFGLGWGAVNVFLGAIATSFIFQATFGWPAFLEPGAEPYMAAGIIFVCAVQGLFAVLGHRAIRWMERAATLALVILGAYLVYLAFSSWRPGELLDWRPPREGLRASIGPFSYVLTAALLFDLLVAYNWTWEFIGDFSRFARSRAAGTWGPFLGANLAQTAWFGVGAVGVVFLAVSTGQYSPELADPSTVATRLGFGWLAYFVILTATVSTNAGNIYASALGISNIAPGSRLPFRALLFLVALGIVPLALLPLLVPGFVGAYIFWLDLLGAIVVPLWTIVLVDYFVVRGRRYSDDLFRREGGAYWYRGGWNVPGVASLALGTVLYWVIGFGFPALRETVTATLPTVLLVGVVYGLWSRVAIAQREVAGTGGAELSSRPR